jgi:hypothetical protein
LVAVLVLGFVVERQPLEWWLDMYIVEGIVDRVAVDTVALDMVVKDRVA